MRLLLRLERKCEVNMWLCFTFPVADTRKRFFMPLLGLYLTFMMQFLARKEEIPAKSTRGRDINDNPPPEQAADHGKPHIQSFVCLPHSDYIRSTVPPDQ